MRKEVVEPFLEIQRTTEARHVRRKALNQGPERARSLDRPSYGVVKLKPEFQWRPQMLKMPALWDICQVDLYTGCRTSLESLGVCCRQQSWNDRALTLDKKLEILVLALLGFMP